MFSYFKNGINTFYVYLKRNFFSLRKSFFLSCWKKTSEKMNKTDKIFHKQDKIKYGLNFSYLVIITKVMMLKTYNSLPDFYYILLRIRQKC